MNDDKNIILREEYVSRINKVQDYIESNLSEEFSLNKLSQVACFSPYHFHRIFYIMTGETLFQYIQRVRLEKAAFLLLANRKINITRIALECGFSNQASFAKAFKKYYGINASRFRSINNIQKNKDCKAESNMGKVSSKTINYNNNIGNKQCCIEHIRTGIPFTVEIKIMPKMDVVYIRHTGPYKKDAELFHDLFEKLSKSVDKLGVAYSPETKRLSLFHDNPDLTDDNKLRVSACMTISENIKTDGQIGRMTIPSGKYAIGHFELNNDQYQDAWDAIFADWLPESGYQPDDGLCFELYSSDLADKCIEKHKVDIYIPVKPL
jgi:AraC family transcriptional regulator